jgi:ferredoxin
MMRKKIRRIIKIDEQKCNGCGNCTVACAEKALEIVNGKARLVNETYCDGLGACLGECPQGAITIEERPADEFNNIAVEKHLNETMLETCGCQGAAVREFANKGKPLPEAGDERSQLGHWPVQLALVPPSAPFLRNADILLVADCVPFAYASFHRDFIAGHAVLVACPKLDNIEEHLAKLNQILLVGRPKSLTVVHMEVPCCAGLVFMIKQAMGKNGVTIPLKEIKIGTEGAILTPLKNR